jgi:hypothetical protein
MTLETGRGGSTPLPVRVLMPLGIILWVTSFLFE